MNIKDERGFTLAEVVIAVTILAIVAAVFSGMLFTGYRNRNINRERLECISLATSTLDEIKAYENKWDGVLGLKTWLVNDMSFTEVDNKTFSRTATDANSINYAITVAFNDIAGLPGLFELTASVTSPNNNIPVSIVTRFRGE